MLVPNENDYYYYPYYAKLKGPQCNERTKVGIFQKMSN